MMINEDFSIHKDIKISSNGIPCETNENIVYTFREKIIQIIV